MNGTHALLFAIGAAALLAASPRQRAQNTPPPVIVIKVDDLRQQNDRVHERWQRLVDFAKARKLKINIGIITDSLEGEHPNYVRWIREQKATGLVEFWDHGYDHKEWTSDAGVKLQEFKGTT